MELNHSIANGSLGKQSRQSGECKGQVMLESTFLEQIVASYQPALGHLAGRIVLTPPPDTVEVIPVTEYLQPETLLDTIKKIAARWQTDDLGAAASLWNSFYNYAVLPGVLSYMTFVGVGLDASLDNVSIILQDGEPHQLFLHSLDNAVIYQHRFPKLISADCTGYLIDNVNNLYQRVFSGLFQKHIAIVIDRVYSLTKLSKEVLWCNVHKCCYNTYLQFAELPDIEAARAEDSLALLEQTDSPVMPKHNPLTRQARYEKLAVPGLPTEVKVRCNCCLAYKLGDGDETCMDCPRLSPQERIILLKQAQ